ncbi:MAG: HAMP domain-containing histidine kinase [Elusimicrobia bacterium]|nr:HAMP domain-containing histidine kinase [Elusimicrobiota bacterium]
MKWFLPFSLSRYHTLFIAILSSFGAFCYFIPGFPFHRNFHIIALVSAAFHLFLFLFFKNLSQIMPWILSLMSTLNILLMGFVLHYSGGITSPFTFVFICILIAEAAYGIEYPTGLITALGVYLAVILAEFLGVLRPYDLTARQIYQSIPATLLVVASTLVFFVLAGFFYKIIMRNMRKKLQTDQEEKEIILNKLFRLEASSQIGLLVNKIVHDIRGPLGATKGFIKMLQTEEKISPVAKQDCRVMIQELDRISGLLNHMTAYSKPCQTSMEILDPAKILDTILSIISFYPETKNICFIKRFSSRDGHGIRGNKEQMHQAYFNILKNSIEGMDPSKKSPSIELEIDADARNMTIQIRDNGRGIPKALLKKLTREPISTKKEGTGIGLLLVKEILEAHRGEINITSQEGMGTTIRTQIPLA